MNFKPRGRNEFKNMVTLKDGEKLDVIFYSNGLEGKYHDDFPDMLDSLFLILLCHQLECIVGMKYIPKILIDYRLLLWYDRMHLHFL